METATHGNGHTSRIHLIDRTREVLRTSPWARFGIGVAVGIGVGIVVGRMTASKDPNRPHETFTHAIIRAGLAAAASLLVRNAIEKSAGARS